jgi:lysophospholipase L1-like esterase
MQTHPRMIDGGEVSRVGQVRRVVTAVVVGGGGIGALGLVLTGVVKGQAMLARRAIPRAVAPPPRCDGRYGAEHSGRPIRLVLLGDSSAAGYGADAPRNTVGALIAAGLAEQLRCPVDVHCFAVVGAESKHLTPQVESAIEHRPDVAVICIGGNDVTHRVKLPLAVRHLTTAVRALRDAGAQVVVGTCPDLGTIRPIQPPLRWLARHWSRQLAAAQTFGVVEAGGRTVSLGDLLGPAFDAEPDRMFSWDRFHPSSDGYAEAAAALLPTVIASLTEPEPTLPVRAIDADVRSLSRAAVEASKSAGTEVSPARIPGFVGRFAHLRQRVWRHTEHPTGPGAEGTVKESKEAA